MTKEQKLPDAVYDINRTVNVEDGAAMADSIAQLVEQVKTVDWNDVEAAAFILITKTPITHPTVEGGNMMLGVVGDEQDMLDMAWELAKEAYNGSKTTAQTMRDDLEMTADVINDLAEADDESDELN